MSEFVLPDVDRIETIAPDPDRTTEGCFRLRILYRDSENTLYSLSFRWSDFLVVCISVEDIENQLGEDLDNVAASRRLRQVYNAPFNEYDFSEVPSEDHTFPDVNHVGRVAAVPDIETTEECFRLRILYHDSESKPCSLSLQWSDFRYVRALSLLLRKKLGEDLDFDKFRQRLREVYGLQA